MLTCVPWVVYFGCGVEVGVGVCYPETWVTCRFKEQKKRALSKIGVWIRHVTRFVACLLPIVAVLLQAVWYHRFWSFGFGHVPGSGLRFGLQLVFAVHLSADTWLVHPCRLG